MRKLALFAAITGVVEFGAVLLVNFIRSGDLSLKVWIAALVVGLCGGALLYYLLRISARGNRR